MAKQQGPRFPKETIAHIKNQGESLKKDIEDIAETLARHEKAELVLCRHVNEALEALGRLRFNRRSFFKRPELQVGAGTFLLGAAASCPALFTGLFPGGLWGHRETLTMATIVVCLAIGIFLVISGWTRGSSG